MVHASLSIIISIVANRAMFFTFLALVVLLAPLNRLSADEKARALFAQFQPFIYQIRLFETSSSSKSSIGSGFQVAGEALIATNYHVIADAVYSPDRYRIELLNSDGSVEALKVKGVDVVHDLAILERVKPASDIVQKVISKNNKQVEADVTNIGEASADSDSDGFVAKAAQFVDKAVKGVKGTLTNTNSPVSSDGLNQMELNDHLLSSLSSDHSVNGFIFANSIPEKGEAVFSMGNPRDLGMTVVEGTYNGLLPHSFYSRILFSGSINPGMSGGPAINTQGELVGINVATSGDQLSFLVPVSYLQRLIDRAKTPQLDIMSRIELQLSDNQQQLMSAILKANWPLATVGKAQVIGEMAPFIRCWGGVDDNESARYRMVYSRCFGDDQIYMNRDFNTGAINYEFYWFESKDLNSLQFYNRFEQSFSGARPSNSASKKHVGAFSCHNNFVEIPHSKDTTAFATNTQWKSILCARPYKQFPGLYDVMLMAATVDQTHQGLIAHFSISGVDQSLALDFTRRFMERISWK